MNGSILETALTERETMLRFRKGENLFCEGDPPRGVYVLQSGTVKLLFSSRNGDTKALRQARPGQILGLSSVVTQHAHDCTGTAAEPCEVAFIESADLLKALETSPTAWFSVLNVLSNDVDAVYDDMRTLSAAR